MNYNEVKQHGTLDFPFELYKVYDQSHPRYEMSTHWHTELEFIRILNGELLITFDNRKYTGKAGDIFIANSETVLGAKPNDCVYECIVFDLSFLKCTNPYCDEFIDELLHRNVFVTERAEDKTLKGILNSLFDIMGEEKEGYRFKVLSLIYSFLGEVKEKNLYSAELYNISDKTEKSVLKIKRTISFIRENHDKSITLDEIAKASGLSTKYFCAFFKKFTGKTPIEYLNMYRIEKAARALLGTDNSITEIAYSSGFNDLSYFIKTFSGFKKCTPGEYRKSGK